MAQRSQSSFGLARQESEADQVVEGFDDGKNLDRINSQVHLEGILKKYAQISSREHATLTQMQNEIAIEESRLQEQTAALSGVSKQLNTISDSNVTQLSASEHHEIHGDVVNVMSDYLESKPSNDSRWSVSIQFLQRPNIDGVANDPLMLASRMAQQGSSNSAIFEVGMRDTVRSLSDQAAKYWGLDPDNVFLLDRDGRVVAASMQLGEIIVPDSTDFVVANWQYQFMLVRAGTVISIDNPSNPTGEKWQDFTFNHQSLKEQLIEIAKNRGDATTDMDAPELHEVPTLKHLISLGEEKLKRRRFDNVCRGLEVLFFMAAFILFFVGLNVRSSFEFANVQVMRGIDLHMSYYQEDGHDRFINELRTKEAYTSWLTEVFPGAVNEGGNLVSDQELVILDGIRVKRMRDIGTGEDYATICATPASPPPPAPVNSSAASTGARQRRSLLEELYDGPSVWSEDGLWYTMANIGRRLQDAAASGGTTAAAGGTATGDAITAGSSTTNAAPAAPASVDPTTVSALTSSVDQCRSQEFAGCYVRPAEIYHVAEVLGQNWPGPCTVPGNDTEHAELYRNPDLASVIVLGYTRIPLRNGTQAIIDAWDDIEWTDTNVHENEILLFIYSGSLDSLILVRFLFHRTSGGNIFTRRIVPSQTFFLFSDVANA